MDDLKKNKCRLCSKVFCCEKCRKKHEVNNHNINLACEICIYGKMYSKNMNNNLLKHFKEHHWPLNCVHCKKIFNSSTDFEIHAKCSRISSRMEFNPVTPIYRQSPSKIQTPYQKSIIMASNTFFLVTNTTAHPTTSTPMQEVGNENNILEKISKDLTPLDNRSNENYSSRITPVTSDEPKKREELKGKVRFCDTPNIIKNHTPEEQKCKFESKMTPQNNTISEYDSKNFENVNKENESTNYDRKRLLQNDEFSNSIDNPKIIKNETLFSSAFADSNLELIKKENLLSDHSPNKSNSSEEFHTPLQKQDSFEPKNTPEIFLFCTPKITSSNTYPRNGHPTDICKYYGTPEGEEPIDEKTGQLRDICNSCDRSPEGDEVVEEKSVETCKYKSSLCKINCCVIVEKSYNNENLQKCDCSSVKIIEGFIQKSIDIHYEKNEETNHNKSSSIVRYSLHKSEEESALKSSSNKSEGLWSSMANLVKTVFQGFSNQDNCENKKIVSLKRAYSEDDGSQTEIGPNLKKMKLTDIRCRPTIRNLRPAYRFNSFTQKIRTADKATQTD